LLICRSILKIHGRHLLTDAPSPSSIMGELIHERLNHDIAPEYNTSETHKAFRLGEVRS